MAMKLSPPGLFSTTTDWPHFCESLSANSRAVISTPEPGPSGTMKRTGRVGQLCAEAGAASAIAAKAIETVASRRRRLDIFSPHDAAAARCVLMQCAFFSRDQYLVC